MKVSLNHLESVLGAIRKNYAQREGEDLEVNISFLQGDPGNGHLVDVMQFTIEAATEYTLQKTGELEANCSIEVYPKQDRQNPCFKYSAVRKIGSR